MMVLELIFGFLLIFAGRDLFWLCVGVVGFQIGLLCTASLGISDMWTSLVAAFTLGSAGAVLAMSSEWITVIIGVGFLGGGYLLMNMLPLAVQQDPYSWLIFVVGGIVGLCLMVIIFDWALIMISSLLGASLIVNAFHAAGGMRKFVFIGSMLTGILMQYLALKDKDGPKRSSRSPARRYRQYAGRQQKSNANR